MAKKKSSDTPTPETTTPEINSTEVKKFLDELETLSDHPILLLSAYGLVEWQKNLAKDGTMGPADEKAAKIFDDMNKALGLDKLHGYYQTRINHKLAPTVNELWTAWTYHTTHPFQFSGSRLQHGALCLGSDYAVVGVKKMKMIG